MRICPKKLSALKAEAGLNDAELSEAMGFADKANLAYHMRKIREGRPIRETIIHDMREAFAYRLRRPVDLRELVISADLPRQARRRAA
jgi:hypothetical protein